MIPWIKVAHLLGLILWMGGFLVLTRILRRHLEEAAQVQEHLVLIEQQIAQTMNIGAGLTLATGILIVLLSPAVYLKAGWFHAKLLFVLGLFILHGRTLRKMRMIHQNPSQVNAGEFGMLYGLGALLLTVALTLVLVKPF